MFFYTLIDKVTLYCVQTYVYFVFRLRRLFKLKIEVKSKSYVPYSYPSISKSNLDYSNLRAFFKNGLIHLLAYVYYSKRAFLTHYFFFSNDLNYSTKKVAVLNFFYFSFFFIFKFFFLSSLLLVLLIYIFLVYHITPFFKIILTWASLGFFFYTLISGFVYFIKKTTFSKYTDVLQRFWKRSFSLFWLIEGGLFLVFVYLTLTSSSELFYSYDSQKLFKLHFVSLKFFFFKLCLINLILILLYFLLTACQNNNEGSLFLVYLLTSILIAYMLWLEFYQFYIFLQYVGSFSWLFSTDSAEFSLESELKRSRVSNNFFLICAIAKFWHFIFIVFCWFFYVSRYLESGSSRIPLISTSIQNFLILYLLNLISIYPYIKYLLRKYMNESYTWFFTEFNYTKIKVILQFITHFYTNLI
jgi:hypothetical protein